MNNRDVRVPDWRSLFNEYEVNNELGNDIDRELYSVLKPIVTKYAAENVSLRDLHYQITSLAGTLIAEACLRRNLNLHRARGGREPIL